MLNIGQKLVIWYIEREEKSIKSGGSQRSFIIEMLSTAPESTLIGIIMERIQDDEPYAVVNGKNIPIFPSRRMAVLLVRGFKNHFLKDNNTGSNNPK